MNDERYDVFISELTTDEESVSVAIADTFEIPIEDARRLLLSLPGRVKRDVSEHDAGLVEDALSAAGAIVLVRKRGASTTPPPAPRSAPPAAALPPPDVLGSQPEPPPRRFVLNAPVRVVGLCLACVAVYVLFIYTPTMAGLGVHELGASSGNAVVLLHGYGAPGDDLVPLGETLLSEIPELRIVVVEAPHRVGLGGRTWHNGPQSRENAIRQLGELLDELAEDGSPRQSVVLLGFSQGAGVAAQVSAREAPLAGTAILAGPPTGLELHGRVFVAHGRGDPILDFSGAERAVRTYEESAEVTWVPFDGGHTTGPARDELVAWVRGCF